MAIDTNGNLMLAVELSDKVTDGELKITSAPGKSAAQIKIELLKDGSIVDSSSVSWDALNQVIGSLDHAVDATKDTQGGRCSKDFLDYIMDGDNLDKYSFKIRCAGNLKEEFKFSANAVDIFKSQGPGQVSYEGPVEASTPPGSTG
jgi:hypothetical protein